MHVLMIFSGLALFFLSVLPLAHARPGVLNYGAGLSGLIAVLIGVVMPPEPGRPSMGDEAPVVLGILLVLSGSLTGGAWFLSVCGHEFRAARRALRQQRGTTGPAVAERSREPLVSLAGFEPKWANRRLIASCVARAEQGLALNRARLDGKPYLVAIVQDRSDWDGGYTSVEALEGFMNLPEALAWAEQTLDARLAEALKQPGYKDDVWVEVTDGPAPYIDRLPEGSGHLKRLYRKAALRSLYEGQVIFADAIAAPTQTPYTPAVFDYGHTDLEDRWVSSFDYKWASYFASLVSDEALAAGSGVA